MCIISMLFVAVFVVGMLVFDRIGLLVMRIRDFRTGKKRVTFLVRVK